ncbi:MAG TPA: isochorismatase family cysteine hydrolase [Gemmatimonadaceae bacterium]|nr:isochorismatase family cysteine hydrolase [Gemmatimonadaceae bacterium]
MSAPVALLVIDMLVDFFERQPVLAAARARLVAATNELTRAFRGAGRPVIWVRQEFRPDLSDAFLDMRRENMAITIAGTSGAAILPELHRDAVDHEIVKKRYSAFYRTRLDEMLAGLGVRSLVIAGINTHACVRMAAIDAFQRDMDVTLASDCIASYDADHHDITMNYLSRHIAQPATNAEIIARVRPGGV